MWSFFSRDPARDFAYEIGECVDLPEGCCLWQLFHGLKKGGDQKVSIFIVRHARDSDCRMDIARAALKRYKTLRHPGIVRYIDCLETDGAVYLVTEPVTPLDQWLRRPAMTSQQRNVAITWGLLQIMKTLSFISDNCRLSHNNVCVSAVLVDTAGEWKLAGLEFVSALDQVPPDKQLLPLRVYNPPETAQHRPAQLGCDAWGMGCLIWEVFNEQRLTDSSQLKCLDKVERKLRPLCASLLSQDRGKRATIAHTLSEAQKPDGGALFTEDVVTLQTVEELQIRDAGQKDRFFSRISPILDRFPEDMRKNKILPQLLAALEFGGVNPSALLPIFKLGALLDENEYQRQIVPCLVRQFSSPERQTRLKLLQLLDSFVQHLQPATVNQQVFAHLVGGFTDTSPVLREHTVRACVLLAPKLNFNNLNVELLKHLARLQAKDEEGGIRTNTTVCIGKLAKHLDPSVRQKVLKSAFLRALKDSFAPSRSAGILGLSSTVMFYTMTDLAERVVPSLCALTVDPDLNVRRQAFSTIDNMLKRLQTVSEQPELRESMEREVGSKPTSAADGGSGWAGWAVDAITSVYTKRQPTTTSTTSTTTTTTSTTTTAQKNEANSVWPLTAGVSNAATSCATNVSSASCSLASNITTDYAQSSDIRDGNKADEDQGWEDDNWDSLELESSSLSMERNCSQTVDAAGSARFSGRIEPSHSSADGWEDFDLASPIDNVSTGSGSGGRGDVTRSRDSPGVSVGRSHDRTASSATPYRKSGPMKLGARKF